MKHKDELRSLMRKTLALLKEDKRTTLALYVETNLPYYWLKKFRDGAIKNPSVNRVQYLWEYLTKNKLSV